MISPLIAILSLDMTRKLVDAGLVTRSFQIANASNTSPIIVTTATPHRIAPAFKQHAVISGVAGNDGANGVWEMTAVGPSQFRLDDYTQGGGRINTVGTGLYAGGGTANVAFPDGRILLGRRNIEMQSAIAAPRIVFIPYGSPEWDLDPYGGVIPPMPLPRRRADLTEEQQVMRLSRQLTTERQTFEVHVTGVANPPDPDAGDFDVTRAIYCSLYQSFFDLLSPAHAKVKKGQWASQIEGEASLNVHGQRWVAMVELSQPVMDSSLSFVPNGTIGSITVNLSGASVADAVVVITGD